MNGLTNTQYTAKLLIPRRLMTFDLIWIFEKSNISDSAAIITVGDMYDNRIYPRMMLFDGNMSVGTMHIVVFITDMLMQYMAYIRIRYVENRGLYILIYLTSKYRPMNDSGEYPSAMYVVESLKKKPYMTWKVK